MTSVHMEIEHDERRDAIVARLHGDIDSSNADTIVLPRNDGAPVAVLLDLRDVQYLDSAGLAVIEALRTSTTLHIVAPRTSIVRRALEIAGFGELVPIVERFEDIPARPER